MAERKNLAGEILNPPICGEIEAEHDLLTGLLKPLAVREKLDDAIQRSAEQSLAVLFLDLDDFQRFNDQFGHDTGDAILRQVGSRLSAFLPRGGYAGRMGGDDFVLFLTFSEPAASADSLSALTRYLLSALSAPFVLNKQAFHVSVSVGVSLYPENGANAAELLRHADEQHYAAKCQAKAAKRQDRTG